MSATVDPVAAVDLGSNSFHMLVARSAGAELHVIDRLRESVRLAAGLDSDQQIQPQARDRALDCLARFGQRLRDLPPDRVRAVGTNTLRQAENAGDFLREAEAALGHAVEVISGAEEARLIYAGVVHGLAPEQPRRLVMDIGGGSTEVIAGHLEEPETMESLPLGCVTYTEHYFPDGKITRKAWRAAVVAAERELQPYTDRFQTVGWDMAIGASGTVRAIQKVLEGEGWAGVRITREGLEKLGGALVEAGRIDRLKFNGLSERRRSIFAGGAAVLTALVETLGLSQIEVSDRALREGLLMDLLGRRTQSDARDRFVETFARRFSVDLKHADRVAATATACLTQVADVWEVDLSVAEPVLRWAARLHEIGLVVSHSGYHKHGAYVVENADLLGFSRTEQAVLASLVKNHRGKFRADEFDALSPKWRSLAFRLGVVLRLAILLHRGRRPQPLPSLQWKAGKTSLSGKFPPHWLEEHPLTEADLAQEREYLDAAGFDFDYA